MRVLITGGAGFIGSHLADAFLGRDDQVVVVDDLSRGRPNRLAPQALLHKLSIGDAAAFRDMCREFNPDLICHLAAQIDVRDSVTDPAHDALVNVVCTINVLEAARLVGARVIFASSAGALYGSEAPVPSPEDTPSSPESPYGVAKLCAEQYIGLYNRLYGARHSVLRFSNVYGPRQDPTGEAGVIAVFCAMVLTGSTPVIYGDGTQTRDYVYVGDVVRSFLAAADYEFPGTWNIGTGIETTVLDLVATIADIARRKVAPRHAGPRLGELDRSAVVAERAALDLGWRPTVALREGMQTVYRWMQAGTPDRVDISVG
jgi:UDP-glucose 4-epimerase